MDVVHCVCCELAWLQGFVYDYMHLVCLGVMRKLIKFWQGGKLHRGENVASRLPSHNLQLLSERLSMLCGCIPREFAQVAESSL